MTLFSGLNRVTIFSVMVIAACPLPAIAQRASTETEFIEKSLPESGTSKAKSPSRK